jgi:hypothetical protein
MLLLLDLLAVQNTPVGEAVAVAVAVVKTYHQYRLALLNALVDPDRAAHHKTSILFLNNI